MSLAIRLEGIDNYNKAFIDFLKNKNQYITQIGGNEISLWLYIFFSDEYVNTELFDKEQLKVLAYCDVSLALIITQVTEKKIKNEMMFPRFHFVSECEITL